MKSGLRNKIGLVTGLLIVGLMLCLGPQKALATSESITATITVASGARTGYTTVTLRRAVVKDIILNVPTLDSGYTSSCTVQASVHGLFYTPRTATQKDIGNTADGALVLFNSSAMDVWLDQDLPLKISFGTQTPQAADRTIKVVLLVDD